MPVIFSADGRYHGTSADKTTAQDLKRKDKTTAQDLYKLCSDAEWERIAAADPSKRVELCATTGELLF